MTLFIGNPQASTLSVTVQQDVADIIAQFKAAQADNTLTLPEMWGLLMAAMTAVMHVVEQVGQYDGATKKTVVMDAVGTLYDSVFSSVKLTDLPPFLESLAARALKPMIMQLVNGGIDALTAIFNRSGWPNTLPTLPTPVAPPTLPPPTPPPILPAGFKPY